MTVQIKPLLEQVEIEAAEHVLRGTLTLPEGALGVVLFAYGSSSSRSPRNQYVAGALQRARLGTLLFDLLDELETSDRHKVFDIQLLAERLQLATAWLHAHPSVQDLPVGYFGAGTGAAAALVAAGHQRQKVAAVVSHGGRPDLADDALQRVEAPTLFIVGDRDSSVLQINRRCFDRLRCEKELAIVPGASHLFEEPGALEQAARLAKEWFRRYLEETPAL
jgi:dienelactone hydrolase